MGNLPAKDILKFDNSPTLPEGSLEEVVDSTDDLKLTSIEGKARNNFKLSLHMFNFEPKSKSISKDFKAEPIPNEKETSPPQSVNNKDSKFKDALLPDKTKFDTS